jgi:hypothetical protein
LECHTNAIERVGQITNKLLRAVILKDTYVVSLTKITDPPRLGALSVAPFSKLKTGSAIHKVQHHNNERLAL